MAIWQYKLFAIPEEEYESYFKNNNFILIEGFDNIEWWKYREYESIDFSSFNALSLCESWTKEIIMLGNIDSDCVEVLMDKNKVQEISIRVDLKKDYGGMVNSICKFGNDNNLCFLNVKLKVLFPERQIINQDIIDNNTFGEFIAKISDG
jgi:hypothetical protein